MATSTKEGPCARSQPPMHRIKQEPLQSCARQPDPELPRAASPKWRQNFLSASPKTDRAGHAQMTALAPISMLAWTIQLQSVRLPHSCCQPRPIHAGRTHLASPSLHLTPNTQKRPEGAYKTKRRAQWARHRCFPHLRQLSSQASPLPPQLGPRYRTGSQPRPALSQPTPSTCPTAWPTCHHPALHALRRST